MQTRPSGSGVGAGVFSGSHAPSAPGSSARTPRRTPPARVRDAVRPRRWRLGVPSGWLGRRLRAMGAGAKSPRQRTDRRGPRTNKGRETKDTAKHSRSTGTGRCETPGPRSRACTSRGPGRRPRRRRTCGRWSRRCRRASHLRGAKIAAMACWWVFFSTRTVAAMACWSRANVLVEGELRR